MIYPEDTIFLIISILIGFASFVCLYENMLFGSMSCFILSLMGIIAHFRARHKEKMKKKELEAEKRQQAEKENG